MGKLAGKAMVFVFSLSAISLCGFGLASCNFHKNPLIKEEIVGHFNGNLFLSDKKHYPIRSCSSYYGWKKHPEYKLKCDNWTEAEYKHSLSGGIISLQTTLKDFRDPKFWQLVNPDAIEDKY